MASLLLLYSSSGDVENLKQLAEAARSAGQHQIAFLCLVLTKQFRSCCALLQAEGRYAEAALFCRTYCPSLLEEAVAMWRRNRVPGASIKSVKEAKGRREAEAGSEDNADFVSGSRAEPLCVARTASMLFLISNYFRQRIAIYCCRIYGHQRALLSSPMPSPSCKVLYR